MSKRIREICWACTEPILEDEELAWAVPHTYGETEQAHHAECVPSTFFVEEDEVHGFVEEK